MDDLLNGMVNGGDNAPGLNIVCEPSRPNTISKINISKGSTLRKKSKYEKRRDAARRALEVSKEKIRVKKIGTNNDSEVNDSNQIRKGMDAVSNAEVSSLPLDDGGRFNGSGVEGGVESDNCITNSNEIKESHQLEAKSSGSNPTSQSMSLRNADSDDQNKNDQIPTTGAKLTSEQNIILDKNDDRVDQSENGQVKGGTEGESNENDTGKIDDTIGHNYDEGNNNHTNISNTSKEYEQDNSDKNINNARDDNSINKVSASSISLPIPSKSRSDQRRVTLLAMEDASSRAEYMATFHARPAEVDRRSGQLCQSGGNTRVITKVPIKKGSTHIFQDDESDDNSERSNIRAQDSNNDQSKCLFGTYGFHPNLVKAITGTKSKFCLERPTIIQSKAWKLLLPSHTDNLGNAKMQEGNKEGTNVFIKAETGSGKTLAYLLPVIQSLAIDQKTGKLNRIDRGQSGTRSLILLPTRELALQTSIVAERVCRSSFSWLVPGRLTGGEKRKSEKARLRKGVTVLIATPGRLLDHLEKTGCLITALKGNLKWIVLDEADRLLDLGFGGQVERIMKLLITPGDQPTWRSILVSATVDERVKALAKKLLGGNSWVWADGGASNQSSRPVPDKAGLLSGSNPRQLTQLHIVVTAKLRLATLVAFLVARIKKQERTIVFMATCDGVDFHYNLFQAIKLSEQHTNNKIFDDRCAIHRLHGNVPHATRRTVLSSLNSLAGAGGAYILLATDVAARGLDLPSIDWTVQYDAPAESSDYIHRAGRSARAGKGGSSLLFLLPSEKDYVEILKGTGAGVTTALSLTSTLKEAAAVHPNLVGTRSGNEVNKLRDRDGEVFASRIKEMIETCILLDDQAYKKALKLKNSKDAGEKLGRREKNKQDNVGPLLVSARAAYSSYIRAYPAKEKSVRHIFSVRALHLGHLAGSFGLQEPPKTLSRVDRRKGERNVPRSSGKRDLEFATSEENLKIFKKNKKSDFVSNEDETIGSVYRGTVKPTHIGTKAKMMAMAAKIQGGGTMEFL